MKYLELMFESAKNRDKTEFNRLNELFEVFFKGLPVYYSYDLFRQSCLCCFNFPELYEESINDAINRLRCLNG